MRLAELITRRKDESGLSFQRMAQRATDAGFTVNRATLHSLTRDQMHEWPRPETLRGIAVALDVPEATVLDATAESLGIRVQRPPEDSAAVRAWLALTGERSQEEIDHLLTAARAVAAAMDSRDGSHGNQ